MPNPSAYPSLAELEAHFLVFMLCCLLGWILEVAYRSWQSKHFVNAGFLRGPFLPIYGLGALFIIALHELASPYPLPVQLLVYGGVLTLVEYGIGALSEKVFGLVLWDYTQNRFNIHGRVCLGFSALWALLAGLFLSIYPAIAAVPLWLGPGATRLLAFSLALYLIYDFLYSARVLRKFVNRLSLIHLRSVHASLPDLQRLRERYERLLLAFPNLKDYLEASLRISFRERLDEKVSVLHKRFFDFVESRQPRSEEFRSLVRDILKHSEFRRLREFRHHKGSIYQHAMAVAYLSYKLGKYLGLDYRAMARGGLLHDFFLYDWRNHDVPDLPREEFHGFAHPRIALLNAEKHFEISGRERDIILKHMWPLTWKPPCYQESLLVSLVDKWVALREYAGRGSPSRQGAGRTGQRRQRKRDSRAY